jgi:hypothetical protein
MTTLEKWKAFSAKAKDQLNAADIPEHATSFIQYKCEPSFESYFNIVITWKENEASWHKKTWDIWKDHEHYFERDGQPKALVIDKSPTIVHKSGTLSATELATLKRMIKEFRIVPVIDPLSMFTLDGAMHSITLGVDAVQTGFSWHTLPEEWKDLEMLTGYLLKVCGELVTLNESLRPELTDAKDNILRIDNSAGINLENIQNGVLIVNATWSGPSIANMRRVMNALREQKYAGQVIVVDIDCMLSDFQMNRFGELCHGWGEIFLISNGVIIKKYTGRESYKRFIMDQSFIVKGWSYEEMVSICKYFEEDTKRKKKPGSFAEFKIASEINNEIARLHQLTINDVKRLIQLINGMNQELSDNYRWLRYKTIMAEFLKTNGYSTAWENGFLKLI